jgi:hypothetical protein
MISVAPAILADPAATNTGSHDTGGPITEAKLGLKIYPGAKIVTSGETAEIVSANLRTADAPDKVIAFYEAELGSKGEGDAQTAYTISGTKAGRKFAVSLNSVDGTTSVSIMGRK